MLMCKEVSVLATKAMDGKLTFRERSGLRLHIMMCGLCRRYVRDMKRLREAIRNAGPIVSPMMSESFRLTAKSRERIGRMLKEHSEESR